MLIGWNNLADEATLAAGSEISTLPGANVQHAHLSRKWHTVSGVVSSYLVFDLGSSLSCALLAVLGTNLTPDATLRLRASDADSGVTSNLLYDSGTISAGVKSAYGAAYLGFTAQAARYWRLDLSDASLPDNLQVGRVFLGLSWEPTINLQLGCSNSFEDNSQAEESDGGQEYIEEKPRRRLLRFTLDFMGESEMYGNAFEMARANGMVHDVLAIPDIDSNFRSEQAVWGRATVLGSLTNRELGIYQQQFEIRERL